MCVREWGGAGTFSSFIARILYDQLLNSFIRLVIHSSTSAACHHISISRAGFSLHVRHAPGHAFCCMTSNTPVSAGVKDAGVTLQQISPQLYVAYKANR